MGVGEDRRSQRAGDDLIGRTLGHCTIQRVLGVGGMATVYLGRQEHLDRDIALKVLPAYYAVDVAFVDRFKLEAKAMARLTHPNIVIVHDAGEEDGRLYIVMEYVAGGNLGDRIAHAGTLGEITRTIREIASALSYAHSRGVVHRDIKPANVLLDTNGRAVLSDFGIAKVFATTAALTRVGAGVGTPEYMSPEQCRGVAIDSRCDIYALGIMLYELLTGRTPFQADSYTALAHAHVYDPVPPPSQFNPRISPAVQSVVLKALEKDPSDRFQQATELSAALNLAVAAQTPMRSASAERRLSGTLSAPVSGPFSAPASAPLPMAGRAPSSEPARARAVRCQRCGQHNATSQTFCSSCGQPLGAAPTGPLAPHSTPAQITGRWIACPQCRSLNHAQDHFCTSCGQTLAGGALISQQVVVVCRGCGQRSAPGQHYCTRCGQPLE